MTLNGVMAVTVRHFTKFGKHTFHHNSIDLWRNLCTSLLYFVVHERGHHKESSRSLSHLLMSFLCKLQEENKLKSVTLHYMMFDFDCLYCHIITDENH